MLSIYDTLDKKGSIQNKVIYIKIPLNIYFTRLNKK